MRRAFTVFLLVALAGVLHLAGGLLEEGAPSRGREIYRLHVSGDTPRLVLASDPAPETVDNALESEIENIFQVGNAGALMVMLKLKKGDVDQKRFMPIFIGSIEARSIAMELLGRKPERPMTHDLLRSVIQALGGRVERITVTEIREHTFYALISVRRDGKTIYIDARPSDSIALALRTGAKIFIAPAVMRDAGQQDVETPAGGEMRDGEFEEKARNDPDFRQRMLREKGFI